MKYIITGRCVDTDGESVDFNRNSCDWYSLEDNSLDCGLFDVESTFIEGVSVVTDIFLISSIKEAICLLLISIFYDRYFRMIESFKAPLYPFRGNLDS